MPETMQQDDVAATLKRLEARNKGLKEQIKQAHGHAVFPSVGKAALVVGGSYGRGLVFEKGKFIGYATITQLTLGVQIDDWTGDHATVTLPMLAVSGPTKAEIVLVKSDGYAASKVKVKLVQAPDRPADADVAAAVR